LLTRRLQLTHRVTINYPQRQKHVVRVSPSIVLSELYRLAVERRDLDPAGHELRHPTNPDLPLDMNAELCEYAITEVTVAEKPPTGECSGARHTKYLTICRKTVVSLS